MIWECNNWFSHFLIIIKASCQMYNRTCSGHYGVFLCFQRCSSIQWESCHFLGPYKWCPRFRSPLCLLDLNWYICPLRENYLRKSRSASDPTGWLVSSLFPLEPISCNGWLMCTGFLWCLCGLLYLLQVVVGCVRELDVRLADRLNWWTTTWFSWFDYF